MNGRIQIRDIAEATARHFGIEVNLMCSKRRSRGQRARTALQVAMYVASTETRHSQQIIGNRLGDRERTTVPYAVAKVEEALRCDPEIVSAVIAIRLAVLGAEQ